MDLAEEIKSYYLNHHQRLPKDKQFHLASRLVAWDANEKAKNILRQMKDLILVPDITASISNLVSLPVRKVYGRPLRLKYFTKYPLLFGVHEAMFRVRHLREIYGVDARRNLLEIVAQKELEELYSKLVNDYAAIRILSRFAVDYIALYEYLFEVPSQLNRRIISEQKQFYDLTDPIQLHLLIYLFTHVIIADTNFYIREVPLANLPVYREMLDELDNLLAIHKDVKLDNKFEYLVASQICDKKAPLKAEIDRIAQASLDKNGKFIVDKSLGKESRLNTFGGSEHRNVLYIMGNSAYNPNSQRV